MVKVPPAHIAPPERVVRNSFPDGIPASGDVVGDPTVEGEESDVPTLRPPPPVELASADALADADSLRALAPPPMVRIAQPAAVSPAAAPPPRIERTSIPRIEPQAAVTEPVEAAGDSQRPSAPPPPITPRKTPSLPGLIRVAPKPDADAAAVVPDASLEETLDEKPE
jgi:hypothetical protein